jgi:signal transduction histidine kinase
MLNEIPTVSDDLQSMSLYATELELEVDRLRRRDQYWMVEAGERLTQMTEASRLLVSDLPSETTSKRVAELAASCQELQGLLDDMRDPPGFLPLLDEVAEIPLRPFVEQIFRWQQRLSCAPHAVLREELDCEFAVWFPVRLRHILENVISNSLKYADRDKGEVRVGLSFRLRPKSYEIDVTDNGIGISDVQSARMLDLGCRAVSSRVDGMGVGLAAVKTLVERCCGTLTVTSDEKNGTNIHLVLPRYEVGDYVE